MDILFSIFKLNIFSPNLSLEEHCCIHHHSKRYLIIGDTLYRRGIDTILRHCLTHDEVERVLNDYHLGACGGHLFGMDTTQKSLRASYFFPSIFKYCIVLRTKHQYSIEKPQEKYSTP
jgi:hypothetical protein